MEYDNLLHICLPHMRCQYEKFVDMKHLLAEYIEEIYWKPLTFQSVFGSMESLWTMEGHQRHQLGISLKACR